MELKRRCDTVDRSALVIASAVAETRERWSSGLAERFVIREVAERQALEDVMSHVHPAVLLLDIALPGLGRVDGLPAVQILSPATRTIVLSDRESESEGVSVLVSGAKGYYTQAIEPALLEKAVLSVSSGELWVKRTLAHALVAALVSRAERPSRVLGRTHDQRRLARLTPRQREVTNAISRGENNKEIARQLNMTVRTVKAHLTEIFRRVEVMDRLQLGLLLNDAPEAWDDANDECRGGEDRFAIGA